MNYKINKKVDFVYINYLPEEFNDMIDNDEKLMKLNTS